jgi:uncharacterized damage-inducible protein DinB
MAVREALIAEFDHEMAATRRLLACTPDAAPGWKPHERSRSFAQLVAHMTEIVAWTEAIMEHDRWDLDTNAAFALPDGISMLALRDAFADAVTRARTRMDRSDAELCAAWMLTRGDAELFTLPRAAALRTFVLGHVVHHRGQLSVYLRLNEIAVPAIYGPTADSGAWRF